MAVTVEMHNTGDTVLRAEVVSVIEHVLSDRPGDWRVSIVGSQANEGWEMKIIGANAFERSYTLERIANEHDRDPIPIPTEGRSGVARGLHRLGMGGEQATQSALTRLNRRKVPWMIVTSKTRAEGEVLQKRLGNEHPFIVENGGAAFVF